MAIRKEMYGEWKTHPATAELRKDLVETLESLVGQMVGRMEPDYDKDAFTRAFARAVDAILNWQPEFLPDEKEEDDGN